jgi:hypothetical protein
MKSVLCFLISLPLTNQVASAATVSGNSALALASIIAEYSSLLGDGEKRVMTDLWHGRFNSRFAMNNNITVKVDSVVCRASDVDITLRSCELSFGKKTVALKGRKAHELFATLVVVGVSSEGAAGKVFESLSHLICTINPYKIHQRAGGGANCSFNSGVPDDNG